MDQQLLNRLAISLERQNGTPEIIMVESSYFLLKLMDGESWDSADEMDRDLEQKIIEKIGSYEKKLQESQRKLNDGNPFIGGGTFDLSDQETRTNFKTALICAAHVNEYNLLYATYGETMSSIRN